jgi:hypothetical protein
VFAWHAKKSTGAAEEGQGLLHTHVSYSGRNPAYRPTGLPGASFVFLRRLPLVVMPVELDEYPMRADARGRVELQEVVMQVPAWIIINIIVHRSNRFPGTKLGTPSLHFNFSRTAQCLHLCLNFCSPLRHCVLRQSACPPSAVVATAHHATPPQLRSHYALTFDKVAEFSQCSNTPRWSE